MWCNFKDYNRERTPSLLEYESGNLWKFQISILLEIYFKVNSATWCRFWNWHYGSRWNWTETWNKEKTSKLCYRLVYIVEQNIQINGNGTYFCDHLCSRSQAREQLLLMSSFWAFCVEYFKFPVVSDREMDFTSQSWLVPSNKKGIIKASEL